ncbi:Protein HOTHEAD [Linum perenne]
MGSCYSPAVAFSFFFFFFFLFHGCRRLSASQQGSHNYTFVRDATTAPTVSYYDYIIVGGGTAGCPLAATLSQNATVLVLERGGSPYGNPNITKLANFANPLFDESPSSPAQRFISKDGVINSRARVLGGGTCLNAGFYSRASTDYITEVGWKTELAEESYEWVEKKVAFRPPMGEWQSAIRDGLVDVGVVPNNGFTYDHNYGTKFGGSIFDTTGLRHTAADLLDYANPHGITVLLKATARKILFRTKGMDIIMIMLFLFITRDAAGVRHKAYLKRGSHNEIIVSAGALGSPQLLMLSGVGPAHHLLHHNITVVLDQPMVGQLMSDNPMNAVYVPSPVPVEISLIEVVGITHFGAYIEAASGVNFGGYVSNSNTFLDGLDRAAIYNMSNIDMSVFQGGFILEKIMGPLSTGHLELTSRNPKENPSVTFNYFNHPEDLARCVKGMLLIEKLIDSKPFSKFKYDFMTVSDLLNITGSVAMNLLPKHDDTATSLEQFCKDTVMTIWHYHGGCQVGAVVDTDYKVLGVDALRVIDGSTFNASPGTNPQATVMMLGRYML